ncbi:MAG: sulfurtransferase-like selenium metabolism protein YedF [Candidatus Cloacimonetes bacterium]|nr:sulfurtransferase-like selenium metabolism protein YedF [Candidatus Cloacimonadota bacterium]
MKKTIDASGQACPKPVLMTKDALETEVSDLTVIVDNPAAKENVSRFALKQGHQIKEVEEIGSKFQIRIIKSGENVSSELDPEDYTCEVVPAKGKTVFISKDKVGEGDDELGGNLMKAFIYSLNEVEKTPSMLIFMNSGVKLCVEGAETLPNLLKLEEKGIEMLVCGTCLNFFGIAEKLRVGKVSNMYDIASILTSERTISI